MYTAEVIPDIETDIKTEEEIIDLPLPFVTDIEVHSTRPIDESEIPIYNSTILSKNSLIYGQNDPLLFANKQLFVKGKDNKLYIPKVNTKGISETERAKLFKTTTDEKGNIIYDYYKYKDGKPITNKDGYAIPIPSNSCKLKLKFLTDNVQRDTNKLASILKKHLDRPELISFDGHTLRKHKTDAILAIKAITDPQLNPETYYKLSSFNSKGGYIIEKPVHNFEITTENIVKIEGEKNPEKLIHTQIAEEIANSVRDKIGARNPERNELIGENIRAVIKGFTKDDPILAIMLYNEIKYLLKYNYNADYDTQRKYDTANVDEVLPKEKIKEIIKDNGLYSERYMDRISTIFSSKKPINRNSVNMLYSFESKIDECLNYFKEINIPEEQLQSVKASGHFNRYIRPVVILDSTIQKDINGNERIYPVNRIRTAYLQEFNTYIFSHLKDKILSENSNTLELTGFKMRATFNRVINNEGKNIKNIHLLNGSYVDNIASQTQKQLGITLDSMYRYSQKAVQLIYGI